MLLRSTPTYTGSTTIDSDGVLDLGGNTFNTTGTTVALRGGTLQDGTVVNNGGCTRHKRRGRRGRCQGTANLTIAGRACWCLPTATIPTAAPLLPAACWRRCPGRWARLLLGDVGVASGGTLEIAFDSPPHGATAPSRGQLSVRCTAHATLALGTAAGNFTFASSIAGTEALASVGPTS